MTEQITQEILDIILSGDVDDDLAKIERAVYARRALKGEQQRGEEPFVVGRKVEVVEKLRPNYLFGHRFEIVKVNDKSVCVNVPSDPRYRRFSGSKSLRLPKSAVKVV